MKLAVAALLAGLFAVGWQEAPRGSNSTSNVEHIESGELTPRGGDIEAYRIRLLPVASFPDLPQAVAAQLDRRGCMIPQSFEAQEPENVIHGSFRAQGSSDWAALCSVEGTTTLYVFLSGHLDSPLDLRSQPDTAWLGAEPGSSVFGSAWGISVRSAADLRETRQMHGAAPFDHDGIEDARLERSANVHYFDGAQWLTLPDPTPDSN